MYLKNELLGDTYPFYADCQEEFMSCVTNLSNPSLRKLAMLHFKETLALVSKIDNFSFSREYT